jgi:hypothetical protein
MDEDGDEDADDDDDDDRENENTDFEGFFFRFFGLKNTLKFKNKV